MLKLKMEDNTMKIKIFLLVVFVALCVVISSEAKPSWKIPLEAGYNYYITTEYGGLTYSGSIDEYHTDMKNGYYAIDFDNPKGYDNPKVVATAKGVVVDVYSNSTAGYGYGVKLDHGGDYTSIYGHFKKIPIVKIGDVVEQGQILGVMGSTGNSTGIHLHWSTRYQDKNLSSVPESKPEPLSGYENIKVKTYLFSDNYIYPVGKTSSGSFNKIIYDTFVNNGGYDKLGLPFSNYGGGVFVHDWRGITIQDFQHPDCPSGICPNPAPVGDAKKYFGKDGQTAIIYNPHKMKAFLVREGFWGKYKENNGPEILGPPTSEEFSYYDSREALAYGNNTTRQNFQYGYLIHEWATNGIKLYTNSNVLMYNWQNREVVYYFQSIAMSDVYIRGGQLTLADLQPIPSVDYSALASKITINGSASVNKNSTSQYSIKIDYNDGTNFSTNTNVGWAKECSVGSIDAKGLFTASNSSSDIACQIKAVYGHLTANLNITVKNSTTGTATPDYIFNRSTTANNVQTDSPYLPIGETHTFTEGENVNIWYWFELNMLYKSVTAKADFYLPNGSLNNTFTWSPTLSPSQGSYHESYRSWITLFEIPTRGACYNPPAQSEGQWTVKLYLDSGSGYQQVDTNYFTVKYTIRAPTMPALTVSSQLNTSGNFTLSWNSVSAGTYGIQQSSFPDFRDVLNYYTTNNSYNFTRQVGTYYYRVRGESTNVCQGNWSNVVSTVVVSANKLAPSAPTMLMVR
jgi:hypothetical protein